MATFLYFWKTPDNERHSGEIEARDKESAYAALRARGIRAIKVEPKDSKAGQGMGRRTMVEVALACIVLGAVVAWWIAAGNSGKGRENDERNVNPAPRSWRQIESDVVEVKPGRRIAKPRPRRQVSGMGEDGARMDEVFRHESEQVLALFAQPGRMPPVAPVATPELAEDFYDAMDDDIWIEPNDSKSVADIKRIVAGLKEEAETYLSSGKGVKDLLEYLMSRQKMEAEYRASVIGDYDATAEDADRKRDGINAQLRAIGLETIDEKWSPASQKRQ